MSIRHQASVVILVAAVASAAQIAAPVPQAPVPAPPAVSNRSPIKIAPDFLAEPSADARTKKAYEALFKARQGLTRELPGLPHGPTRSIVCGLTIWNVDPDIDPRMRLSPPQPPDVTYAIRKITPPVCQR